MGFFGNSMPGYGGGMFPTDDVFGVPDFMGGINQALAQNSQVPKAKKGGGVGDFLKAFAGTYGDALTGNPAYAQHMRAQEEARHQQEWYERKRQDELADYEAKKNIDAQYSAPDKPGLADEFDWYRGQSPEVQQGVQEYMKMRYPGQFVPPTPIRMEPGDTIEGGGQSDVTATNPQTGEKIRLNPSTGQWEKVGGPSSQGSGGFP
jgi:hypothetical protein